MQLADVFGFDTTAPVQAIHVLANDVSQAPTVNPLR